MGDLSKSSTLDIRNDKFDGGQDKKWGGYSDYGFQFGWNFTQGTCPKEKCRDYYMAFAKSTKCKHPNAHGTFTV
jgi:hypothetical protein